MNSPDSFAPLIGSSNDFKIIRGVKFNIDLVFSVLSRLNRRFQTFDLKQSSNGCYLLVSENQIVGEWKSCFPDLHEPDYDTHSEFSRQAEFGSFGGFSVVQLLSIVSPPH